MWLALALACGGGPGDAPKSTDDAGAPPTGTGPEHALIVTGGYGGGSWPAGSEVHVWAGVDPQVALAGWSGGVVPDPVEWNGTITMPDHDLTVTATSTPVDAPLDERTYTIASGERHVLASVPAAPVGVVLFFHGAGYSIDELRMNAPRTVTMTLRQRGYGVVALPSEAETANGTGGWSSDLADSNPDLVTTRALVQALRDDGTIPSGAPIFAMGMSSGGMFAHTAGAALPTDGVVAFCAPGTSAALAATAAPTGWFLAANDQTFPTAVTDATQFAAQLGLRGIATDLYVHPTTPLYDERFTRVSGIDLDRSRRIADALRAADAVDGSDRWIVTGASVTAGMDLDGLDGLDADQLQAVAGEIEIMAADHEMYDDAANRVASFLDSLR